MALTTMTIGQAIGLLESLLSLSGYDDVIETKNGPVVIKRPYKMTMAGRMAVADTITSLEKVDEARAAQHKSLFLEISGGYEEFPSDQKTKMEEEFRKRFKEEVLDHEIEIDIHTCKKYDIVIDDDCVIPPAILSVIFRYLSDGH